MVSSSKKEAKTSCKIYCGQPLVDGIGSVSSGVMSTVGLELRSFINSDLTWKAVSKRNRSGTRRTRKPVAESMTLGLEIANKNDKKLEKVTVSESEKFGVDVLGQHFSEKLENVPIKKRRFMFRSPSPPPPNTPCPLLETSGKHLDFQITPDHSSGSSSEQWKQLMKSDCSATSHARSINDEKISELINGVEDFSGIEILSAVACSDSMCNNVTEYEGTPVVEESTQERIQSSDSSIHLEDSTASLETACCFPKGSVNKSKFEGSYFQDNSFVVLHEVPSDKDTIPERSIPLCEFPSGKGTDLLVNESKSDVSSFQDDSFSVLYKIPSDKNTLPERFIPLPDDRLLWDLNVPMDAWPCDGGIVDSQNDSIAKISVRSEELQTAESQDIKTDTITYGVSSDVDGSNRMTSDLRSIPTGTDDLGTDTEKQESSYGSQDIDDTAIEVVSSEVDGGARMTSDFRSMPVETDNLSAEEQESSYDSQYIKIYTTKEEISSDDVGVDNSVTSDSRVMPIGTDDLSSEKQEYEGCSGFDTRLPTKELQDMKNDTTNEVVSSDVDGGNGMTSDMRTIPLAHDECSTEKQETEGCSGYDSQFEDGELRESNVQCWEEIEQVDYDTEFEEERPFGLEPESCEQEVKVDRGSNPELAESFKCCETGEALRKSTVSLKIRNVEVSNGETMKFDCLDRSYYDLRVDLSKESKNELLSCVEGSVSFDVLKSRPAKFNGSYPRVERGAGSDRFMGSGRSSHMHRRRPDGACIFNPSANYWDSSKCEHTYIPNGPYNLGRPRSNSAFGNRGYLVGTDQSSSDVGVSRPDHRTTRQFMGSYRPLLRRSPIGREDSYNMHIRMPTVRDTSVTSPDQNRFRRFLQRVGRGIRDEYLRHVPDDSTQYMGRMLHHLDRRERSISSHGGRPHHAVPYKSARSRSRSRSPFDLLLQRDRNEDSRPGNRSPDFVSDARMDRVKLPFTKRSAAGYGEFVSPPRNHASPQQNSRMFMDRNPGLDHSRGRKSHVRMIRQDQRFDQPRPIRRFNSDDCFNPMIRPIRFPDRNAGGRGCTYGVNDDGNHDTRYAMNHRVRYYNTDGGARRFRYKEEDSFMAKNSLTVINATEVSSRHPNNADAPRTASEHR